VTDPRIGAFARLASGNVEPKRTIYGNVSKLTRVAHGIAYDAGRDEIWASEPLASSVVAFAAGTAGEVPPLRVIQGPKTQIHQPWGLQVDDLHHELVVADHATSSILVFPWDANGNVAPLRVIGGPRTRMRALADVAVDPRRNLLVAVTYSQNLPGGGETGPLTAKFEQAETAQPGGIFIFDRTANGNVPPKALIAGPHTGIGTPSGVQLWGGRIYAVVGNAGHEDPYVLAGDLPRKGCMGPPPPSLTGGSPNAFIGVWKITDNGDVGPMYVIHGPASQMVAPVGIALNPRAGELYVTDGGVGATFTFLAPQFF